MNCEPPENIILSLKFKDIFQENNGESYSSVLANANCLLELFSSFYKNQWLK